MNESPLTTEALQERLSGRPTKELTLAIAREAMTDAAVLDTLLSLYMRVATLCAGVRPGCWRR